MGYKKGVLFLAIVGMNPLFFYLFALVGGAELLREIAQPFVKELFGFSGFLMTNAMIGIVDWPGQWYICYFMYKKKIFINI